MALTAIEMLTEAGLLRREIVLLLNSDEEIGSPVSRPITEALATKCAAVYVLEPAQGLACKTARKGIGNWRIEVHGRGRPRGRGLRKGRERHPRAGARGGDGERLDRPQARPDGERRGGGGRRQEQRDSRRGLGGGGCAHRRAKPTGRASSASLPALKADGQALHADRDRRHQPAADGAQARRVRLYRQGAGAGRGAGLCTRTRPRTGGASDGNFTAALGIPTLDGMGAVGEGAHARHESVVVEHLAPRTALLAGSAGGMLAPATPA